MIGYADVSDPQNWVDGLARSEGGRPLRSRGHRHGTPLGLGQAIRRTRPQGWAVAVSTATVMAIVVSVTWVVVAEHAG